MIKLEFTKDEIGLMRGAFDLVVRQGGLQAARQLMALDDKVKAAYEAQVEDDSSSL
jgi:hypothetical protein